MSENEIAQNKTPWHLWAVGVVAFLWSAMGLFDFTATVARFEPYLAQFPQEMLDYWYSFPWWMFAIWGVGSASGLAGAVLLLMKNKLAFPVFAVAFASAVLSMAISFIRPGPEGSDGGLFAIVIIIIAGALPFYAWRMRAKGVLH